ncbi:MAG: peptidylprolyl isomerase [Mariprofundaceae bacterium]|nr:peptidylprolyl isomerase [Mariprofundaceae bacterium]
MKKILLLLYCCCLASPLQARVLDSIAVLVNNEAITCYDVTQDEKTLRKQLGQSPLNNQSGVLRQRVMDSLILKVLQRQQARRLQITASDAEISQAMADVESNNDIPAGQLVKILKAQGMNVERYKQNLSDRILNGKLINIDVRSRLQISEESMREYYRKYLQPGKVQREIHLAQIFIALANDPSPKAVSEARAKMASVRAQAKMGEDFNHLAKLFSDDPAAQQGGKMGWFRPGTLPSRFQSVMTLPQGQLSDIIRSPAGFHLMKVIGEKSYQPDVKESYTEVRARHILLKVTPAMTADMTTQLKTQAQVLSKELRGVSDKEFAVRAQEVSQGPSADKGGDLGWFRPGEMLAAFDQVVFNMEAGEVSAVVKSRAGFHVIYLVEKRHVDPNSFIAHSDTIKNVLMNAEMQNELPRWMARLKSRAQIQRKLCL